MQSPETGKLECSETTDVRVLELSTSAYQAEKEQTSQVKGVWEPMLRLQLILSEMGARGGFEEKQQET